MYWKLRDNIYKAVTRSRAYLYTLFFLSLQSFINIMFIDSVSMYILLLANIAFTIKYNWIVKQYFLWQIGDIRLSTINEPKIYWLFVHTLAACFFATAFGVCLDDGSIMQKMPLLAVEALSTIGTYFFTARSMTEACVEVDFTNKVKRRRDPRIAIELRRCTRKYVGVPFNTQNFTGQRDLPSMISVVILSLTALLCTCTIILAAAAYLEAVVQTDFQTLPFMLVLLSIGVAVAALAVFALCCLAATHGAKACYLASAALILLAIEFIAVQAKSFFFLSELVVLNVNIIFSPTAFIITLLLFAACSVVFYLSLIGYFYKHWDNRKTKLNWNTHKDFVMLERERRLWEKELLEILKNGAVTQLLKAKLPPKPKKKKKKKKRKSEKAAVKKEVKKTSAK